MGGTSLDLKGDIYIHTYVYTHIFETLNVYRFGALTYFHLWHLIRDVESELGTLRPGIDVTSKTIQCSPPQIAVTSVRALPCSHASAL